MGIKYDNKYYQFYENLPIFLQNSAISVLGIKRRHSELKPSFKRIVTILLDSMNWDYDHMNAFREKRLAHVLQAASNTPFYKNLLGDINAIKHQPFDVLATIPVLDKETLRENPKEFINGEYGATLIQHGTSGTTGTPLQVFWTPESISWGRALVWRHRILCGHPYRKKWFAQMSGFQIVPMKRKSPPFWRVNLPLKQVLFSTYHINPDTALAYAEYLNKSHIEHIEGYPSAIYSLAKSIDREMEFPNLESIFFGSEPMHSFQQDHIRKTFDVTIWSYYGLTERVVSAMQIPGVDGLYVNSENCVCEIIDSSNHPVIQGEIGEIVGTSLSNLGFPILRYKTGDISSFVTSKNEHPIITPIDTKREDLLTLPDGTLLSASNLTYAFKGLDFIRESQIYQKTPNLLQVRIVPDGEICNSDVDKLICGIRECIPLEVEIEVIEVKRIERTKSGKFRFCISDVESGDN